MLSKILLILFLIFIFNFYFNYIVYKNKNELSIAKILKIRIIYRLMRDILKINRMRIIWAIEFIDSKFY